MHTAVATNELPSPPLPRTSTPTRRQSPLERVHAKPAILGSFLLGLGSRLEIQFIGFLPFSEIAMLAMTPFILPKLTASSVLKTARWLLPLALLWLGNQIVTDVYRETNWSLAARGAARVIILLVAIPFFIVMMRKDAYAKLVAFYAGATISAYLSGHIFKSGARLGRELVMGQASILTWETYWGPILLLATAVATLILYKRSHLLAYSISAAAAVFQILGGSRSIAGMVLFGPTLCIANNLTQGLKAGPRGASTRTIVVVGAAALLGAFALISGYSWAAQSGMLGETAYAKYKSQSVHKYGLLFGGRGDVLCAALAIYDSPLIGHGSWPRDTKGYYARACEMTDTKMQKDFYKGQFPLIMSHSHLMGAWMEAGIFGGVFWIYVLALVARCIVSPFADRTRLQLWACTVATSMAWNICFSPISARLDVALILAVFLTQAVALGTTPGQGVLRQRSKSHHFTTMPLRAA
jgi:hypothetical protein